ncbi:MAG TPA: flippase activity-associated protein Agl23 [Ktedonobacteraceae bacterium]
MKSYDTQPDEIVSKEAISTFDATEIPEASVDNMVAEVYEQPPDATLERTQLGPEVAEITPTDAEIVPVDAEIIPVEGEEQVLVEEENVGQDEPGQVSTLSVLAPIRWPRASAVRRSLQSPASSWPSRDQWINLAPFWGVFLLGVGLRFWNLGAKPLHHDESLHGYYALQLLHNLQHWGWCVGLNNPPAGYSCYQYDPLLHGPFQFHAIALVYQVSQWLGAPDNGVNTTTVRIMAALLGSLLVALPFFLRDYLGKVGAWLACFLLAVAPSMVYFSRFARESIYMAFFTLLLVVAVARYVRTRQIGWLVLAAAGFALSYATSEATFLTIAIFGSFLGALVAWELGSKLPLRKLLADQEAARYLPRTFAFVFVPLYFLLLGIAAKLFFSLLNTLSVYINNNQAISDQNLLNLESITVKVLPWLGILLGLVVFAILAMEVRGIVQPDRRGLARLVDRRQPVLDTLLTMPWTHWFFALIVGLAIFLFLFSVVFTNIAGGIGDGIWKGLYYWLEQQHVARGGQPWYYYLLLIPLYEQIGVVFSIVGIIRSFWKPNQFRLFMVYWFLGDFFIYSWAGEKMPWLMVFMTMPMLILAAIGLEPCVIACYRFLKERFFSSQIRQESQEQVPGESQISPLRPRVGVGQFALGLFGVVMALLLLLPTIHNMYEVAYVEPADGPHEMMIYVQTTTDINRLMAQLDAVDKKNFGGTHQMRIGISAGGVWPLAWYLRDYPNLCFNYPTACPSWVNNTPVIITGGDDYIPDAKVYVGQEYKMRSWWDEGYKLPACQENQTPSNSCADPNLGTGIGPLLWLDYGDTLPQTNAKFDLKLAIQHIWDWWWYRRPFGSTDGYYPMALYIQNSMGVNP